MVLRVNNKSKNSILQSFSAFFILFAVLIGARGDGSSEEFAKVRREASIGSYSYTSSDIAKHDSHVKTVSVLKNFEMPSHGLDFVHAPMKQVKGKTTVEFWPPDMDKEKFYSMKHDIPMWTQGVKTVTHVEHIEKLPEKIRDIPVHVPSHTWKYRSQYKDFEALSGPTEATVIDDSSITEAGPVLFPTSDPTTRSPDRQIVFVSRGNNNKKRKLKKKARPAPVAPSYTGQSETAAPYLNSAMETTAYNQNAPTQDATPIYEVIDEPGPDIFQPIMYTKVINNLSDLTEQSFGTKPENSSKNEVIVIDYPPPINVDTINANITSYAAPSVTELPVMPSTTGKPATIEDLMPLEKFLNELKQAIDERDIAKIKNIVRLLDEGNVSQPMTRPVLSVKPAVVAVRSRGLPRLIRNRTTTEATTSTFVPTESTSEPEPVSDTTFEAVRVESTSEAAETIASSEVPAGTKIPDVAPSLSRGYIAPPKNNSNTESVVKFRSRNEPTTTEVPATMSTIYVTTEEPSTFRRSRIYLAPRVRQAKLPKETGPDDVLKENIITVTELKATTTSLKQVAEWLQPTTTEEMAAAPDPVTTVRPTRRRSRSHNLKIKNHVVRSRQAAKNNIRRRIATRRPY